MSQEVRPAVFQPSATFVFSDRVRINYESPDAGEHAAHSTQQASYVELDSETDQTRVQPVHLFYPHQPCRERRTNAPL
jgi:hypothetical protein